MGVILRAHCAKCGYERRLFIGGGLKDCEMKTLGEAIPKKLYWKFKAALATMRPGGFNIDRKAGFCRKCGVLGVAPVVTFENRDGGTRVIEGFCSECGGEIDFLEHQEWMAGQVCCRDCGELLETRADGHWD